MVIACLDIFEGVNCEDSAITLVVKLTWNSKIVAICPIRKAWMTDFLSWRVELMLNQKILPVEEGDQPIEVDQ